MITIPNAITIAIITLTPGKMTLRNA